MLMPSFLSSSSQLNDGEGLLSVQRINSSLTGGRRPACGLAFPPCTVPQLSGHQPSRLWQNNIVHQQDPVVDFPSVLSS